jgi:uncharacterized membrane protein
MAAEADQSEAGLAETSRSGWSMPMSTQEFSMDQMSYIFYGILVLAGIGMLLKTIVSFLPKQNEADKLAVTILLVFRYLLLLVALAICLYMLFMLEK